MKVGYVIASNRVMKDRLPVGYLYRETPDGEGDSGCRLFSGEESQQYADEPANFAMYNASTVLEIAPEIAELLGTESPVAFERGQMASFTG